MKINPPISVIALVCLAVAAMAWNRQTESRAAPDERCDAVIALLKHRLDEPYLTDSGRKLYLTTEPVQALALDETAPTELRNQFQLDPFYPLYRELAKLDGVDPQTECPSLRTFLGSDGVRERFTTKKPQRTPNSDEWDAVFVGISMPAVSADGREAIMLSSQTFGLLAGSGSEVYLRKNGRGEWVVKYEAGTWIS